MYLCMNSVKFKITRLSDINNTKPQKVVGFNVFVNDDESYTAYHETILDTDEIIGKSPNECISMAFSKLSSSLSTSVSKLLKEENNNVIGAYFIPD